MQSNPPNPPGRPYDVTSQHAGAPHDREPAGQARVGGGGVIGCGVANHLTPAGWTDLVLLVPKSLTSGTTWHAAGLVGQLRATLNMTRLAQHTAEVLSSLEEETGQAIRYKQNGPR